MSELKKKSCRGCIHLTNTTKDSIYNDYCLFYKKQISLMANSIKYPRLQECTEFTNTSTPQLLSMEDEENIENIAQDLSDTNYIRAENGRILIKIIEKLIGKEFTVYVRGASKNR